MKKPITSTACASRLLPQQACELAQRLGQQPRSGLLHRESSCPFQCVTGLQGRPQSHEFGLQSILRRDPALEGSLCGNFLGAFALRSETRRFR